MFGGGVYMRCFMPEGIMVNGFMLMSRVLCGSIGSEPVHNKEDGREMSLLLLEKNPPYRRFFGPLLVACS